MKSFCSNCGNKLNKEDKFCSSCGNTTNQYHEIPEVEKNNSQKVYDNSSDKLFCVKCNYEIKPGIVKCPNCKEYPYDDIKDEKYIDEELLIEGEKFSNTEKELFKINVSSKLFTTQIIFGIILIPLIGFLFWEAGYSILDKEGYENYKLRKEINSYKLMRKNSKNYDNEKDYACKCLPLMQKYEFNEKYYGRQASWKGDELDEAARCRSKFYGWGIAHEICNED